jgi:hypothetical protein
MSNENAVVNFKASILARRDLLEFLFTYALKSWDDVQALSKQSDEIHEKRPGYSVVRPGKENEAQEVERRLDYAQWAAQDSANALLLIVGYSLERFLAAISSRALTRRELHDLLKNLGVDAYNGVKLGSALVALGDHARHLHEPQSGENLREPTKGVLGNLCLGETHNQTAVQFLQNVRTQNPKLQSYVDFEKALLEIADDVLLKPQLGSTGR